RARACVRRRGRLGSRRARRRARGGRSTAGRRDDHRCGVPALRPRRVGLHAVSRPPRARRTNRARRLLVLAGLGIAFVLGLGLGEALDDGPSGAGGQTIVRTLRPLPITPLPPATVTVTTSNRWEGLK